MKKILTTGVAAMAAATLVAASPPADAPSANFTGRVGEIVDEGAHRLNGGDTGIPQSFLRHVGDPAPDGYGHDYQWGNPIITTPAGETVTFTGTLDLTEAVSGDYGFIGLVDTAMLAQGARGTKAGVYISVNMVGTDTVWIGVSDGRNSAREYVQAFHTVDVSVDREVPVTLTVVPGNASECASDAADVDTADGCMYLEVMGQSIEDSYGTVVNGQDGETGNPDEELAQGGTAAWDGDAGKPEGTGIRFDLTVSPVDVYYPETKDDCRDAWAPYAFSNQGQCIRFVNTQQDSR